MAEAAGNTTFTMADRGYEVELTENYYPSALNCIICSLIINKATHGCERHLFCEGCIQEYLSKSFEKESPICPGGCRKQIDPTKLSPNLAFDMLISKLKTKCSFKDCSWTGDLLDLVKDHRSQCKYATIKCSRNGCGESFLKVETENHDIICLYKYLQCCYCQNDVYRRNKADHEKSCAMEKVNCIYHEVGCNISICRRDVDKHEHDCQSLHIKLSFQNIKKNAHENVKSSEEINQLKKYINELKEDISDVVHKSSKEINQLKKYINELKEDISDSVQKSSKEISQLKKQNNELKEDISDSVQKSSKEIKIKILEIEKQLKGWGYSPYYIEINDQRMIIKNHMFVDGYLIAPELLQEVIKSPKYDENHIKCFSKHCYVMFRNYFKETFEIIPYHWFDFSTVDIANTQHMITFPIKDNQIEDFTCKYTTFTVESINNTIKVSGFQKNYNIKIVIDTEEQDIIAEKKFKPFDTQKLIASRFSGSACIIICKKIYKVL